MFLQKNIYNTLLIIFFVLSSIQLYAQHEADFWYFGNYAGLDFSSGNPEPLSDGALINYEGCAAISDTAGNLLFYTNGVTVWNKEHQIMQNGDSLFGNLSSTQSSIIIPHPAHNHEYFIVTVDVIRIDSIPEYIHKGLNYSIINMELNNNLGAVTNKNVNLLDSVCEKITAIPHSNGVDFWLLAHEWGNDLYYKWLVSESGIAQSPQIQQIGNVHYNDLNFASATGYMKPSTDNSKLVVAVLGNYVYELFHFNNSNAELSNPITLEIPYFPYGAEFSPDGTKLYLSAGNRLIHLDLSVWAQEDIYNSLMELHEFDNYSGAIQTAKNGKLYIALEGSEYLSVINEPNETHENCNFEADAIYLDGNISRLGLPNFIQSYFNEPAFRITNSCVYDEVLYEITNLTDIDSVQWNFGDPASGDLNISDEFAPIHIYSEAGVYAVRLTVWSFGLPKQFEELIQIVELPELSLGKDTLLCDISSYTLQNLKGSHHLSYIWSDLSVDSLLQISETGQYYLDIENIYTRCKNSDTINIVFSESPDIDLGNDSVICENTSILLDIYCDDCSYMWNDLSEESFLFVDSAGEYSVIVQHIEGCITTDTILFTNQFVSQFEFPDKYTVCEDSILNLGFDFDDTEFLWQDGSIESTYFVYEEGMYTLQTKNICGIWTDSVFIEFEYCGDIRIPNVFSPQNDDINDVFVIKGIDSEGWKLQLYNRWGRIVKLYKNYDNTWDGRDEFGHELSPGVYYYILSNTEKGQLFKGTVRIIR
jgi:gliding motility-associated-like protein